MIEVIGVVFLGFGTRAFGFIVREDFVDFLFSDLVFRCGDRGEVEVFGRGVVGVLLGRFCGRE